MARQGGQSFKEVWGVLCLVAAALAFFSLVTFDPNDLSFNTSHPNDTPRNAIGIVGSGLSFSLFLTLGFAGYLVPLLLIAAAVTFFTQEAVEWRWKLAWAAVFLITFAGILELQDLVGYSWTRSNNFPDFGGILGDLLGKQILKNLFGNFGAFLVLGLLYVASIFLLFELHPRRLLEQVWAEYQAWREARITEEERLESEIRQAEKDLARMQKANDKNFGKLPRSESSRPAKKSPTPETEKTPDDLPPVIDTSAPKPATTPAPVREERKPKEPVKKSATPSLSGLQAKEAPKLEDYELPLMDLLLTADMSKRPVANEAELRENSQRLVDTLKEFDIEVKAGPITKGATITRYEIIPAQGVRVDRIRGLQRDLARAMKAEKINILAPIPGKDSVGIEIGNTSKVPITLKELFESDEWRNARPKARLPLAIGKDVYGHTLIADLAEMPHLLVAGTTGSGKSVCINCILLSLLYTFTPDELRLILVDPKQVEMQIYNTIPHLVTPVVTEPKKAQAALGLVIREMEKRYQILAKVGVRNIAAFNARTKPGTKTGKDGKPLEPAPDKPAEPEDAQLSLLQPTKDELFIPEKLPYWVVIIDELADLMQTEASATVESHIARITAKARAAGIHLIVATQTPRREVVTGVIKTNIPSRIAFQVPSSLDSRVILDEMGAENLLGKGDLLYLPPGSAKLVRGQGAFVSDDEVKAVVDRCSEQAPVQFDQEFHAKLAKPPEEELDDDFAEQLVKAWGVIVQEGKASTSVVQRRMKIGYNTAASLVEFFEKRGLISEVDHDSKSKPREILVDVDTFDIRKFLGIE